MQTYDRSELGATVLRIALGVIYLAHSIYLKGVVFSLPGTAQYFESIGLPGFLAYLVFSVEAIGGAALILGFKTRIAAWTLLPVAVGATWAHLGAGWLFTNQGGGWEYPALLAVATAVQALLGGGAFALSRSHAKNRSAAAIA